MNDPTDAPSLATAVAIIGMSCRFPEASDPAQLWRNLSAGRESVRELSDDELRAAGADPACRSRPGFVSRSVVLEDLDRFDAEFFGLSPRDAEILDPQQRIFLECAWQALEDAGYDPSRFAAPIGVFGGVDFAVYLLHLLSNPEVMAAAGPAAVMLANDKDQLTTRVAYELDLKGPAVTVQTACSSSLVAVAQACQSLLHYQCELALAGGSSIALNQGAGYFWDEGDLRSPDGRCRAFDAAARGIVSGSGSGVVVLKRYQEALADGDHVYAVIRGFGINNDGAGKIGFTAPSIEGQAEAIRTALAMAEVDPATIGYVEAHGTGTPLGDPIEIAALHDAFRGCEHRRFCGIGSIKTNIGHLGSAAGIAGLIKTVLALRHRMLPPSLNFETPNPQIDFENSPFFVVDRLQPWRNAGGPLRAGVSSFGMGGTNAHLVVEEAPPQTGSGSRRRWQLLPLAARTPSALERMTANLESFLRSHPDIDLADVAYTLQLGRQAFGYRRVLVVETGAAVVSEPDENEPVLRELGRSWVHGVEVDWRALHRGERRRRVPLPTYPFERRRFWVSRPAAGIAAFSVPAAMPPPAGKKSIAEWFSVPVWKPAPPLETALSSAPGSWLIFCGSDRRVPRLVETLRRQGQRIRTVGAAPADHAIDLMQPADYRRLLRELRAIGELPQKIVHWWDAHPEGDAASGLFSLLYLAQAIADVFDERPLELIVLTAGRARISPHEQVDPAQAMRASVCPVISKEMPAVRARAIDLPAAAAETDFELLLAELGSEPSRPIVALRHSGRWVLGYEPAPHLDPAAAVRRLRRRGVYLITGGLGGMGLEFARHLAEKVQARLVLVSRSACPDRARSRRLQELEAMGSELLVAAADVSDAAAMAALAQRVGERFGRVDGIIHAAGIAGHGMIALKTTEQVSHVLAAKVRGVETLHDAFAGEKLDFFVLCSSLAALHGGFGQYDYCAANAYLDAFAERHRDRGVIAVNWDVWNEIGMAVMTEIPAELRELHDRHLENAITPAEGRLALDYVLGGSACQVVVSTTSLETQLRQAAQPATLPPSAPVDGDAAKHPRPRLATPLVAPRNETEARIAAIWSQLLGIEPVGVHDDFLECGGHSLLGIRLTSLLRQELGVHVSVAMLFETPTIAGLAQRLSLETISESRAFDRLLPLRERGSLPPLFCVHPVTGLSWSYSGLVRELDPERPIYGLQASGIAIPAPPPPDVASFAEGYLDAIREIQPRGPYHLLGWSFGGLVAYAMACRLRQQDEEVALLALLDSYPHGEVNAAPPPTAEDVRRWKVELLCRVLGIDRQELGPALPEVAAVLETAHRQGVVAGFGEEHADRLVELTLHNDRLYPGFEPDVFDGDLLFFTATEGRQELAGAEKLVPAAWQPYVTGRIETHAIRCRHHDMTAPVPIAAIAYRLERYLLRRNPPIEPGESRAERTVSFLCSGLGGHYPGMGRGLYAHEPVFRAEVDRCCELLEPILGLDLRGPLFEEVASRETAAPGLDFRRWLGRGAPSETGPRRLDATALAQPAVLVIEIALARLLSAWGIAPAALIGYSLGEYTAAHLAGVWSLEDVLTLVAERARLIATLPAGVMTAVPLAEAEVLPRLGDGLVLAAVNAPEVSVIAGPEPAMARFEAELGASGLACRRLHTRHAFHSPMMEPIAAAFGERLRRVAFHPPRIPYLSNVTGTWIRAEEATDPDYWVRHLCQTVRFAEGLELLLADPEPALLELGPGQALATAARQHPRRPPGKVVVATLRDEREHAEDPAFLLRALGQLRLSGVRVDRGVLAVAV